MECNKEEAIRAVKLAEKKMQENDFVLAQKLALKAQRLYPEIENISRLLTVCEVHCSSQVKLGGSEMDWYKILQIELTADVAAIKKQYRKLALQLHPDKNMFPGAEAAFKLVGEANRTLTDEGKRGLYDRKYRDLTRFVAQKPSQPQSKGKPSQNRHDAASSFQRFSGPLNAGSFSSQQVGTFWTRCPSCGVSYQYFRSCLGATLACPNCHKYYIADEIGVPSSFQSVLNQKEVKNQAPPKVPSQVKKENLSRKRSSTTSVGPHPTPEETNAAKSNGVCTAEERENGNLQANKQGVETPKPEAAKPEKPESSKKANKKRARKLVVESSESEEDDVEENVNASSKFSEGSSRRRSSRQKQNISYKEKPSDDDDDDFVSPPKRSRVSKSASAVEEESKEGFVKFSAGSGSTVNGHKEFKQNSGSPIKENSPSKNKSDAKGKEVNVSDHQNGLGVESISDDDSESETDDEASKVEFSYPDAEFNDFEKDKAENCFDEDQIWAIYDPEDGMPRFYALIKKVCYPEFKLRISWLEAKPDKKAEVKWCNEELPVACGKFQLGESKMVNREMFSHRMHCIKGRRNSYLVYPRKGETWAIFKDWDINWSSDPEKHKPFKFDFVEVVTDFDKEKGAGIVYLERVKGFVSLFQQTNRDQVVMFQIFPNKLYIFSHRIPSFRMTGKEREGVPLGSFELDPAALPLSFFESCDHHSPKKDSAENHGFPNSQKSEAVRVAGGESKDSKEETLMARRSPRKSNFNGQVSGAQGVGAMDSTAKNDKSHGNLTPSKRGATASQADEKINTPKKQESHQESEAFSLRRSPRDLSKKSSSEVNGSQSATEDGFTKQTQPEKSELTDCPTERSPATKPSGTPNGKISQPESFDFARLTTTDRFNYGEIWALRTDGDPYPKTYGQVKKIDPKSQIHLVLLEPSPPPEDKSRRVSCGTFRARHEKSRIFPTSLISHRVNATTTKAKEIEIYPCKGEIWALHKKSQARSSGPSKSEFDIVEVLEDSDRGTRVVVLSHLGGSESLFKAPRVQKLKSPAFEIPRAEISRFSHQIPAVQHAGEKDSQLAGCWELDPKSMPPASGVICLD